MKLLVLSIDGRGVGHLNRTLLLARALTAEAPEAEVRFLVESPAYTMAEQVGFPTIKLPDPMHPVGRAALRGRRAELEADLMAPLLTAWRPDAVLIDFVVDPILFDRIRAAGSKVFLVVRRLRQRAMAELAADPAAELVDAFVVPHWPEDFGPGELPASLRPRLHFTGPLVRRLDWQRVPHMRKRYAAGMQKLVAITLGGGGWRGAADLADAAGQAIPLVRKRHPDLQAVLVCGPLFEGPPPAPQERLEVVSKEAELPELMAAADAVICSAGYNTTRELQASGTPGILVPLTDPGRDDQVARAGKAARAGWALVARREPADIAAQLDLILSGQGPALGEPTTCSDSEAGQILASLLRS